MSEAAPPSRLPQAILHTYEVGPPSVGLRGVRYPRTKLGVRVQLQDDPRSNPG